jgi:hypothetical protein
VFDVRYLGRYLLRRESAYILITLTALLWGAVCGSHAQIIREIAPHVPQIGMSAATAPSPTPHHRRVRVSPSP